MRPQFSTHESPGRLARAQVRLLGALALAALTPALALASHYIVDASGGGDFVTIQAAVNATMSSARESLLIEPGMYPESVTFAASVPPLRIVGSGGATMTSLYTIVVPKALPESGSRWHTDGLTFDQFVDLGTSDVVSGSRCVFAKGLYSSPQDQCSAPSLHDCTFYGRTWLLGFVHPGAFTGLHFVAAPLQISSGGCGNVVLQDCTFDGPADTLVLAKIISGQNQLELVNCAFRDAGYGVACAPSHDTALDARSCTFQELAGDAIREVDDGVYGRGGLGDFPISLYLSDSRFERCGTAVRWLSTAAMPIMMTRDTILECVADGAIISPGNGFSESELIVERSGGSGLVIDRRMYKGGGVEDQFTVRSSRFIGNRGDGVVVVDSLPSLYSLPTTFVGNLSEQNGHAGFRLDGGDWRLRGNVAHANGADGIVLRTHFPTAFGLPPDSIVSNTCAENGGDGIRLEHDSGPGAYLQMVEHNLSAFNEGNGIATTAPHSGTVAFNDAWKNALAEYVSVASASDSNLTVNPQFCKHPADALTLRFGSKCGSGGVYGLIGAEPEACRNQAPSELEGGEDPAPTIAFSARPNPARGLVELAVPACGADGRIEVLDAQGRRVWARDVRAGERVRWTGETAAGRASPGLYLVRLTRPGETRFVRVAWME